MTTSLVISFATLALCGAAVAGTDKTLVGSTTAPFELKRGEDIQLRIFVDRSVVEVFANDRQAVAKLHGYAPDDVGVSLFSKEGDIAVKNVRSWKMKSVRTRQGNREASALPHHVDVCQPATRTRGQCAGHERQTQGHLGVHG